MNVADALRKLHEAGRIRSPWLAGMLIRHREVPDSERRLEFNHVNGMWLDAGKGGRARYFAEFAVIDLTDPATLGCLLALVREASGDPDAYVDPLAEDVGQGSGGWWVFDGTMGYFAHGDTEAAALSAALIAIAEGL